MKTSGMVMKSLRSNYRWLILLKDRRRRKEKVARRARLIQMTFVITAKNLIIGRNILLLSLSRMIPNMKMIWVMVVGEQLQQHSEQWVLDSGCSYHMCPHRSWFVTYKEKSDGNVLMTILLASQSI